MIYLVALFAQLGGVAEAEFSTLEHNLFVIESDIDLPDGQQVLLTNWTVPPKLDYRQQGTSIIGTGPPGEYVVKQQVVTARVENDSIKLPVQQHFWQCVLKIEGKGPRPPPDDTTETPSTTDVDRLTYVYERTQSGVPRDIAAKFQAINAAGKITATAVDKDTTTGGGAVPEQYKEAFAAAVSLPSLVVQSAEKVIAVVENPTLADVEKYIAR